MDLDIIGALQATPSASSGRRCVIQKWLDAIPADNPGLDSLVTTIMETDQKSPEYRTRTEVTIVLARLGLLTTAGAVGDHRGGRCVCHA
jgi:hypothetical protein